ncbi:DUF6603 domain-containing protein [Agrococcus sp. Ld7]|uniref:DUF6603 domain-containing protein n=1 Tax=Agrococcus sp. Ld7 TaxID=649148 RepID=UPI00386EE181
MTLAAQDLSVAGDLGKALGIFTESGAANSDWFGNPQAYLTQILAKEYQRNALISFVDAALGGEERETAPDGSVWLPVFGLEDPNVDVSLIIDSSESSIKLGLGVEFTTTGTPEAHVRASIPLFVVSKAGSTPVTDHLWLGQPGARITLSASVTITPPGSAPTGTAAEPSIGAIGVNLSMPTSASDGDASFGLDIQRLLLPGATTPRDLSFAADSLDELDDAVLDLVLALVQAQADAAGGIHPVLGAVAGLLGLTSGDAVPDFPLAELRSSGITALAGWVRTIMTTPAARTAWLEYLADLLGGTRTGETVGFDLGSATLAFGLRLDTGPTGNARLTPTLSLGLGGADARCEARLDLCSIDLVTASVRALPSFGIWAASGTAAAPILHVTSPALVHADTLRVGFGLDADRRLVFVLAADGVELGGQHYPTLDLTSPDAVMDAAGNAASDVLNDLLANLSPADDVVKLLLGLDPPTGVAPITLGGLMSDPLAAVTTYWRSLLGSQSGVGAVLLAVRDAVADGSAATGVISGTGAVDDPWRVGLIGPLDFEISMAGDVASFGLGLSMSVDTLGAGCTVVDTSFSITLAEVDFADRTASLLPSVSAQLTAHESGVTPDRVRLGIGDASSVEAARVGLRLGWTPAHGLSADLVAPDLAVRFGVERLPVVMPVIGPDGTVSLPPEGWSAVERLLGHLGEFVGGVLAELVRLLGWSTVALASGGARTPVPRLALGELIDDPAAALRAWTPSMLASELGPQVLDLVADLLEGGAGTRGALRGSGHPDDPYRLPVGSGLPAPAVWFSPDGPAPRYTTASDAVRNWRPGEPPLSPVALARALEGEATLDAALRGLVTGRPLESGLSALIERWQRTDGRITAPESAPSGVTVLREGAASGQLLGELDLPDLLERTPAVVVHLALGPGAWPDAPVGQRVDLTGAGLTPEMFALPAPGTGEWFVELGGRADCRTTGSLSDGTPEQAARLRRLVQSLVTVSTDIAVVAVAGAGHAARLVAESETSVTALVTLGTPLTPISLAALSNQPTADALRLLDRLLPALDPSEPDDDDLALGRALVASLLQLAPVADPGSDLRPPEIAPPAPRAGLDVFAVFGEVSDMRVSQAITAIVCAALADRAQARARIPLATSGDVAAGVCISVPEAASGSLRISGDARLQLARIAVATPAVDTARHLRIRLAISDRTSWLVSGADLELRAVSADVSIPLDDVSAGTATVTLHDARVFGQSWEALVLGAGPGQSAVSPEARTLLAVLASRLGDVGDTAAEALDDLLAALGVISPTGGIAPDAVDQLLRNPGGLVRARLASDGSALIAGLSALLGPAAGSVDLAARTLTISAGTDASGRFGWGLHLAVDPAGVTGSLRIGQSAPSETAGGLQLELGISPLRARLLWTRPGQVAGAEVIPLWPDPDANQLARALAAAAPSLGGHVALESMRRLDDTVRPIIDAVLEALGLLGGTAAQQYRPLRPIAGLIADPAGWLRGPNGPGANPARLRGLLDALRPLLGVTGSPGSSLALAPGVALSASTGGRLELAVDTTAWTAPTGAGARLRAGITAGMAVATSGPPAIDLALHIGVADPGVENGRRAVHLRLSGTGIQLFARPSVGADISLLPFAGLGALSAVAEAALPFLLDELAGLPSPVGDVVREVGDALALRTGTPRAFDRARLQAWAANPVGELELIAAGLTSSVVNALAVAADAYLPTAVSADSPAPGTLRVRIGDVTLTWTPTVGAVAVTLDDVSVPGISAVSGTLSIDAAGIRDLSVTVGPFPIDTGSVVLQPFFTVVAGAPDPGDPRRVVVGLAADDDTRFAARWLLEGGGFSLISSTGTTLDATESDEPGEVALRLVEVLMDVLAAVALETDAVTQVLATPVGTTSVRGLLAGVLLDEADSTQLIDDPFALDTVLPRIIRLVSNLGGAGLTLALPADGLTISLITDPTSGAIGVQLGVQPRWQLLDGDISLWLEADDTWISTNPPGAGGLFLGVLDSGNAFAPSLAVNGVGLRIGSASGPLVDSVVTIESVALHVYAAVDGSGITGGGAQLQLSNLALTPTGGGSNGVAQGILRDTGPTPPQAAFSPALAVQKHGAGPVEVTLRAGDPPGPWWLAIRRAFGPLYLEQIGLRVDVANHRITSIGVLMDGSMSMFGLTCAVDDLQITYLVGPTSDFFELSSWKVDLGGIAVHSSIAGLTLAGGLLKSGTEPNVEYLGMLLARFGVYGITIYGGFGQGEEAGERYVSFFAVGAINGPIGGPPAFFLTGIGGGFGINRKLLVPTDLSDFGGYPLIEALDVAAQPQEPMEQLRELGRYFPMKKGSFWFAAGISFNSFALVDGIAVLAVQVGDGLDINLLGLARMALPRPQAALVSIELALLVRFSSSEGVIWVQAQLTDNSWLLYPDVRLTGGFAYVIWFKGEHAGEFVLTIGGYHPDFHRDGYPVVPRLGLRWAIGSAIVIEAGAYFALTSEAIMAGGDFLASARFGPAWAELRFGAHGIVYFDPFRYFVNAYVRISAGITIDLWLFGEVTISISLGARVEVEGPDFHGVATFEVGPVELSVPFGSSEQSGKNLLVAADFVAKYLDPAPGGAALAHAAMVASGAQPAKGEQATPDGSSARPFVVVPEFGLIFTTTIPTVEVSAGGAAATTHNPSRALGVAPMGTASMRPLVTLLWRRGGAGVAFPFQVSARPFGSFPVGVWGPPLPDDNRPVPKAEMIEALHELDLVAPAKPSTGGPPIPYHQVDIRERKPLPFTRRATQVDGFRAVSRALAGAVTQPATVDEAFLLAGRFLAGAVSPAGLAALRGERQAPPRVGTLGEGLDTAVRTEVPTARSRPEGKIFDHFIDPPVAIGLLPGTTVDQGRLPSRTTTVKDAARLWRRTPPTLASVEESRSRSIAARLVVQEATAVPSDRSKTVIGAARVPVTAVAHAPAAIVRTAGGAGAEHLAAFAAALTAGRRTVRGTAGATLSTGETVILKLPNAYADAGDGERPRLEANGDPARVVVLEAGGAVQTDRVLAAGESVEIGRGAERIVATGLGAATDAPSPGLLGWHAGSQLPYVGWSAALAPGCLVRTSGETLRRHRERVEAGWVVIAELVKGISTVTTRFSDPVRSVIIILDDPTAFGAPATGGRGLAMGLDGADRATGPDGQEAPPILMTSENRSVLAYDIVPDADHPAVVVTIATELAWSLVGVMGGQGSAADAVAGLAERGLDAALRPLAPGSSGRTRLSWSGATRTVGQRRKAQLLAGRIPPVRRKGGRA